MIKSNQLKRFQVKELKDIMRKYKIKKITGTKPQLLSRIMESESWNQIRVSESIPERKKKVFSEKQIAAQNQFKINRTTKKITVAPVPDLLIIDRDEEVDEIEKSNQRLSTIKLRKKIPVELSRDTDLETENQVLREIIEVLVEEDPFITSQRRNRERSDIKSKERSKVFQEGLKPVDDTPKKRHTLEYIARPGLIITDFFGRKLTNILGSRPKNVNNFMKEKGENVMIEFNICRKPVAKVLKNIINIATFGKLKKEEKKLNYDDIFHLFLQIKFENGEIFAIEKNQEVIITKDPEMGEDCKWVDISKSRFTFNEVMIKAEKTFGINFYRYDFVKYNCQNFLLNFTNTAETHEFDEWIYQDFSSVISTPLREAGGRVTDLANIWGKLFGPSIHF